jgi:hypothetical protein
VHAKNVLEFEVMNNDFPRQLTAMEKTILFAILPENKKGYNEYREKINQLVVIGKGRFGGNNLILGREGEKIDLSISSAPVFAIGTVYFSDLSAEAVIHEEQDDKIEFDIQLNVENNQTVQSEIIDVNTISTWNPGDESPYNKSTVKEFELFPGKYILAVVPTLKKIWLHSYQTGINHIIPLTNFYNELMRTKNIKDHKIALNPGKFFEHVNEYSTDDLRKALINYSWYLKKFDLQ